MSSPLTPEGEVLRQAIGAAGYELTPLELAEGLAEAHSRIRPGPDGCCIICKHDGSDGRDFRFGVCDVCAFCNEPGCPNSPAAGPGRCIVHGGRPHHLRQWWYWIVWKLTGRYVGW